ncbi:unnamed protein product [Gadus morhua 'NCC']
METSSLPDEIAQGGEPEMEVIRTCVRCKKTTSVIRKKGVSRSKGFWDGSEQKPPWRGARDYPAPTHRVARESAEA